MADLAEAFEQHLRSLSDTEWEALTKRVRSSPSDAPQDRGTGASAAGLAEAKRRGYVKDEGKAKS